MVKTVKECLKNGGETNRREIDVKRVGSETFRAKNAKSDTSFPCRQRLGGGPECVAGRGDQYIEHGGYTWRTLDGADPQGGEHGAPNNGCQCIGQSDRTSDWCPISGHPNARGDDNYLPLPAGWVLAPNDATSIDDWDSDCHPDSASWPDCDTDATSFAVVVAHGWSTDCVVLADGTGWASGNSGYGAGDDCGWGNVLATSGGTYTVTRCYFRVLARCG